MLAIGGADGWRATADEPLDEDDVRVRPGAAARGRAPAAAPRMRTPSPGS